jgi:HYDIN/CFA65/VesB family protein
LLTSLTDITLKEVVEDDLAGRGVGNTPVTTIMPSFNVHDTAVVDPGLIDISMAYGYLRAADVMSTLGGEARGAAMLLSDAIARLRTDTHLLSLLWANPNKPGAHAMLQQFRFRKWLIRKLVEARIASKVPLPPLAMLWFQTWETGASAFVPTPWSAFTTISQTTPAVAPYSFVPGGFVFDQEGDLNTLFIVQAGAVFHGTASTIGAVGGSTPTLTVPAGTTDNLPRIPVAGTVVAEAAPGGGPVATAGTWFVDSKRRYLLNPAAIAVMPPLPATTFVPTGGLTQIPNGGDPYWVGGLVVSNSVPELIHEWDAPELDEGSRGSTAFLLWNRSSAAVEVASARITTTADTQAQPVFTVRPAQPFTVQPGQVLRVDVDFVAPKPGSLTGMIEVTCNDAIAKDLRIPLSTSVQPLGPHGELSVTPETIDFGKHLVGTVAVASVTVTNTGGRRAYPTFGVASVPSGQYSVDPYAVPDRIEPGASAQVNVAFTPSARGASQGMFVIDMESGTGIGGVTYKRRYEVPLNGTASMPTIFLAAQALPPVVPHPHLPPIGPPPLPHIEPELTVLDFGAPAPGTTSTRSFWLRNVGDAPLTVSGVVHTGSFGITNPGVFPATIAPGGELEVGADFLASTRPGEVSAGEFSIGSDDPLRAKATLMLKGSAAGPHLVEANEQFDFGTVPSGSTASFTYRSDGTAPVTVERVTLSGHDFSVSTSATLPAQLAPGSELKLTVTVAAITPGQIYDTLMVYHDAKPSGHSQVALRAYVQ